jgi:predicted dehydrogenase
MGAAAGVSLMVGHCFRRLGAARRAKGLLDEGVLGTIVLAEASFSLPGTLTPDQWRFYRQTCPGGPLMQLGIHHADTLQYLLGPVRRVRGAFAHLVTQAEIDDVGVALLEFEGGARGALTSSYVSPKTFSLRLFGTAAVLDYRTDMSVWPDAERLDGVTTLRLHTTSGQRSLTSRRLMLFRSARRRNSFGFFSMSARMNFLRSLFFIRCSPKRCTVKAEATQSAPSRLQAV